MPKTVLDVLSSVLPFWEKLSSEDRKTLLEHTRLQTYAKGSNVHGRQEKCTGFIIVVSGQLRAYLLSEEGKQITIYRLLSNDLCLMSASCVLKNISFNIVVDAETDTAITLTNPDIFDAVSKRNPEMEVYLREAISARFSEAMWVMEQTLFNKFDKRLANFLFEESALEQSDTIVLTHEQIAAHLGSAREVVSRMLKYFASEGLVKVSRKGITLLDRKRLKYYL
ncbi:MAG: DNA-binding transcriptional dual regulator Crp [Firmicutes bacterium ADurb.Bin182]|nr:MAG: DNA-binding transcriptional dual regulator Crp [Firmicutes bacterium ADurb.Bin182]